jgi:hypothetical protein
MSADDAIVTSAGAAECFAGKERACDFILRRHHSGEL